MNQVRNRAFKYGAVSVTTWSIFLLIWVLISYFRLVPSVFIPSPLEVWHSFVEMAFQGGYKGASLWAHLATSMARIGLAFFIAISLAVPIGLLSGLNRTMRAIFAVPVYFYRSLPPLAYYTLLIIWLGIGDMSKIALLFLAGFSPIFIACMSAVENVNPSQITMARSLGASPGQLFTQIIFPACLPEMYAGIRTAFGVIYTTLVAAEMVAAVSGVGWMVLDASKFLQSDVMFVGIILMGVTGALLDGIFVIIEKALIPWKGKGS